MNRVLFCIALVFLIAHPAIAQAPSGAVAWHSVWMEDSVMFAGSAGKLYCAANDHDWAVKDVTDRLFQCSVIHDGRGCPDQWRREWRICKVCLRKSHWREIRYWDEPKITDYDQLDEKVIREMNKTH